MGAAASCDCCGERGSAVSEGCDEAVPATSRIVDEKFQIAAREDKKFVAFASHMKMEAAAEARLVKLHLEALFNDHRIFLDSDDLK